MRLPLLLAAALGLACASPAPPPAGPAGDGSPYLTAVETARSALGARYRRGGASPGRGFDCSGLVAYSFARAGFRNLPRTARALEAHSTPIPLSRLRPGDLLFFTLSGKKTSHVAIYEGRRHFIHAPSSGNRVERVSFDHVYWGPRIRQAGRLPPL